MPGPSHEPAALDSVRLIVLDVDGVLTDGRLYYGEHGETLKVFHVRDGHGLRQVMAAGVRVAVISGRRSAAVSVRCRELGIEHVEQGCDDKAFAFGQLCARLECDPRECLCVVDDTSDIPLMQAVGFAVAVADAHPDVLRAAHRVTSTRGGHGAVREVCDWLLEALGVRQ